MARPRLLTPEISLELRQSLASHAWSGFTLQEVPTGRDPRRFDVSDHLPALVVEIGGTVTAPRALGGVMTACHLVHLFLVFSYEEYADINLLRLQHGQELFDWLCEHKTGTYYKAMSAEAPVEPNWPRLDYSPGAEDAYVAQGRDVAVVQFSFAVIQKDGAVVN